MRKKPARVLLVVSVVLVPLGVIVPSPEGVLLFMFLAGIFSSIAAALGAKGIRHTALVVLVVAASIAVWRYPDAKRSVESWQRRALETSTESQEKPASE